MTGAEVLEQIFHDKDSDDSDIELGDDVSDTDDEQPVFDVQDAVNADDSQLDDDGSSVLNADNDDDLTPSDDDDDDAEARPRPPKLPRLNALWTWQKCDKDRAQPPWLSVDQQEQLLAVCDRRLTGFCGARNQQICCTVIADNIGSLKPQTLDE